MVLLTLHYISGIANELCRQYSVELARDRGRLALTLKSRSESLLRFQGSQTVQL